MKECFIVTPIGDDNSAIRRETDGLISSVFTPILNEFDLKPVASHSISETGSITRQIIQRLIEADLVIANLTELNPNVMYELGIRHCSRKPTIVIARDDVNLPFDISDERTIFYRNDICGVEELKDRLKATIPGSLEDLKPDNPVYRVVDYDLISLPEDAKDSEKVLNMRLSQLEDQLSEVLTTIRSSKKTKASELLDKFNSLNQLSFYVHEYSISDFLAFLSENNISSDDKQVYKDQILVNAYPQTKELRKLILDFTKQDTNGIKRI